MAADDTNPDPYPKPGEVIEGKYELQEVLGTGAMGRVVRAQHLLRKVPVALKFVSPTLLGNRDVIERFLNEGVASSRIDSEHVVKVHDVSELASGVPYLVMEYLKGEDLAALLRREGRPWLPDPARAVHFTLQILRGLQAAHRVNIIHRDMKPSNCFVVSRDGEPDFIKIVDFGISKLVAEGVELTQATAALGTPLYMSLEQARSPKDVDARTDLYSVAVILYEMLVGVTPFVPESGSLMELFGMLANEQPRLLSELRSDLPPGLDAVVQKGLLKDRRNRYQTAEEMAEALAPFSDERSDHVVTRLLRTVPGQLRSRPPPSPSMTPGPMSVQGTLMMSASPAAMVPVTEKAGPVWAPGGAGSSHGAVTQPPRTVLEERRGTPLVYAVAIVAVGGLAAAAWALGKLSTPSPPASAERRDVAVESARREGAGPPGPDQATPNPTASASASATATSAASASATVGPAKTVPAPSARKTLNDIRPDP